MYFQMDVRGTFRLGERMTAFIGPVQSDSKFIRACECEIVIGNEVKGSIHIDGEMIPKRIKTAQGEETTYRAISTSEKLDFDVLGIEKKGFIIRSVQSAFY